jgi:NTP pyrophosphatase (non-canonical NTP hydrolase)
MMTSQATLAMDDFQTRAFRTDQNKRDGMEGLRFPLLGLFGEAGSLLSALKKKQRDRAAYIGYRESVIEEFGDVLWYFSNIAARANLKLSELAGKLPSHENHWSKGGGHFFVTFADLQPLAGGAEPASESAYEQRLIELGGKVGRLLDDVALGRIERNRDALTGHLVEILRAVVSAADEAGVSLEDVARHNLDKTNRRWPQPDERIPPPLFDEDEDPEERLPRRIEMNIMERGLDGKRYVRMQWNGVNIGDRLTDNKTEPDDYRFHDVFHMACAAILGWSPVTRALLKVKRKSNPTVDENQDGARAQLVEESISTWIFAHALELDYFRAIDTVDYPLLKAIEAQVKGYEVERCPLWLWEKAILDGYRAFRCLREQRKGIIIADLRSRSIEFKPIE